jgi:hydroxymethylpyrimidine/phosphomethylpyrimidine kinase
MAVNLARVLIIAGSDSSGGAGIVRDVETVTALGLKAAVAITAVTAQSDRRVRAVQPMEPALVAAQMEAALEGGDIRAVKIGMLADAGIVGAVAAVLARHADLPVVLDPVLASTSGRALLDKDGVQLMIARLLPRADLVTPNLPELAILTGLQEMQEATERLLALGIRAALIKGGHANDAANEMDLRFEAVPQSPPSPLGEKGRAQRGDEGVACSDRTASPSSGPSGHRLPDARSGNAECASALPSNADICRDTLIRPGQPNLSFESPRHPDTLRGTGCMLASAITCGLAQGLALETSIEAAKHHVSEAFAKHQRS